MVGVKIMAGKVAVNQVQLGDSATASQNFVLQTNVDGTMKLSRGNVGAIISDIFTVDANNNIYPSKRYVSAAQTITLGGLLTLAHGLGAKPYRIITSAICTTADLGYSIGDEVMLPISPSSTGTTAYGMTVYIDATNINIRFAAGATGACILLGNKSTGAQGAMLASSWQLYVRAEV